MKSKWYIAFKCQTYDGRILDNSDQGPYYSRADAERFAENEVGVDYLIIRIDY